MGAIIARFLNWTTYCEYNKKTQRWTRKLRVGRFFRWAILKERI